MIFVTVGTHEQQFDRLLYEIDVLTKENIIKDVFIQRGYSSYTPKYAEYKDFLSYNEMNDYMNKANIIITHGGPSSFMKAITLNKKPIVVPRQEKYKEHINNHQLYFCNEVIKKGYEIFVVENILDLKKIILNENFKLDNYVSNNIKFNENFQKEFDSLFKK